MSNLSVFAFEGRDVRFVGTPETPEWIAADVCACLELENVSRALSSLEEDEKGITNSNTPSGTQAMLTVREPGLYRLIFKSRKDVAKRFQSWVFHEVLPQIRKTGSYEAPPAAAVIQEGTIAHLCLQHIQANPGIGSSDIVSAVGHPEPSVRRVLKRLCRAGCLTVTINHDKRGRYLYHPTGATPQIVARAVYPVKQPARKRLPSQGQLSPTPTDPTAVISEGIKAYIANGNPMLQAMFQFCTFRVKFSNLFWELTDGLMDEVVNDASFNAVVERCKAAGIENLHIWCNSEYICYYQIDKPGVSS